MDRYQFGRSKIVGKSLWHLMCSTGDLHRAYYQWQNCLCLPIRKSQYQCQSGSLSESPSQLRTLGHVDRVLFDFHRFLWYPRSSMARACFALKPPSYIFTDEFSLSNGSRVRW